MFVAETTICWVISKNRPIWEFEQPVSAKKGYTIGKPSSRQWGWICCKWPLSFCPATFCWRCSNRPRVEPEPTMPKVVEKVRKSDPVRRAPRDEGWWWLVKVPWRIPWPTQKCDRIPVTKGDAGKKPCWVPGDFTPSPVWFCCWLEVAVQAV